MLIAGSELLQLIQDGVIDALSENVNAASIDVRLGNEIMVEASRRSVGIIDLDAKQQLALERIEIPESGVAIAPGEFFLAHTIERLCLPDDISCDFMLRSSVARAGLEHLHAGWGDAGFQGSLTLEFKNVTQYHRLGLRPGMRIGQLRFFRHADAGDYSYRVKGRYNNQVGVQPSKGVA